MKIYSLALLVVAQVVTYSAADELYDGPPPAAKSSADNAPYDGPPPVTKTKPVDEWVYVAGGITERAYEKQTTVQVAGSRNPDWKIAKREALEKCNDPRYPGLNCKIIYKYHHGCKYFDKGVTPWATAGYAMGDSPQEAYDNCHNFGQYGLDCDDRVIGGCADRHKEKWPEVVLAPKLKFVRVFAEGLKHAGGYKNLVTSQAAGPDIDYASRTVLDSCHWKNPLVGECHVTETVTHGCRWSAMGWIEGVDTDYRMGDTEEEAIHACESLGFHNCREHTTGGCVID